MEKRMMFVLGVAYFMSFANAFNITVSSLYNCGMPADNYGNLIIGKFAVTANITEGPWVFRPVSGGGNYVKGAPEWSWAVRITPVDCTSNCMPPGYPEQCTSGMATATLGNPFDCKATQQKALAAAMGSQVVVVGPMQLWLWFQDSGCQNNAGDLILEAIPLDFD